MNINRKSSLGPDLARVPMSAPELFRALNIPAGVCSVEIPVPMDGMTGDRND